MHYIVNIYYMKKIYLIVLLIVAQFISKAQVTLPLSYDFRGDFSQSGWTVQATDLNCFLYTDYVGADPLEEVFWFVSFYSMVVPYMYDPCEEHFRSYLVSPRFVNATDDSVQFSFRYVIAQEQPSTESFVVGYCTSDTVASMDDFVWLPDTVVTTNYESWTSYQRNVPANAQYVAIAYTSEDQWALWIDDVLIRPDAEVEYSFTVNANEGGTIAVTTGGVTTYGSTTVREGASLSFTVTPDPGSYIEAFYLDGVQLGYGPAAFTKTFDMVLSDHVIEVVFGHYDYRIQIAATEHGQIVPDGGANRELIVSWGDTVGFRFYPDEGYHVASVALTSNGLTTNYYDQSDTFTIANIQNNYVLNVTFGLNDYVVTATAGEGGIITPSGTVPVQALSSPQFRIDANPGYLIDTLLVDGDYVTPSDRSLYFHTFQRVTGNHTISVTFARQTYVVHYTCGSHGTLTAQGGVPVGLDSVAVYYEDTILFHFVADEGYELSDLQLNGTSLGTENPYLLTHVTQNSLFHASFAEKTFLVTVSTHGIGSVTPRPTEPVDYFDTLRLVVTPGACAQTDSVLFDGSLTAFLDTVTLTHIEGTHTVDAFFSQRYFSVEILPSTHGSVIGSTRVICGGTARLKIVPDHCYRFAHFYLDGTERNDLFYNINDTLWAYISSVDADHTVAVDFERITYNVTVNTTGAGTVSPGVSGRVVCDTTLSFEIIPDDCHYVASVTVNGENAEPIVSRFPCPDSGFGDTLRFDLAQIEQNYVVNVTFQQFDFPLQLTAGEHGTLSATGDLHLSCGTDTVITITPETCYEIATVRVDGEDVTQELHYNGSAATYTFSNIHMAHSLEATFSMQNHTVTTVAGPHGTVTPVGDSIVLCGSALTYLIVPDECYKIDSVWLDDVFVNRLLEYHPNINRTIGDSAIFTLSNIAADHIVRVSFKPIQYGMWAMGYADNYSYDYGSVSFSLPGTSILCGETVTLTMTPADCYSIDEVWNNDQRITDYEVDENGVGTYVFQNVTKNINVVVFFKQNSYSLALAQPIQHGVVSYATEEHICGEDVTVTYRANDCYHLDSVMVGGEWILASELLEEDGVFVFEISDIHSDILLDAAFSIDSVHFVSREGAPLSVMDSVLACGQSLTVSSIREDCHQLDSVRINGTLYTSSDIDGHLLRFSGDTLFVHFENLSEDQDLAVFFSQKQYVLQTQVIGNGQISQPSYQVVACGDSIAIAINPADCHHVAYITLNGYNYSLDNDRLLIIPNMRSDMDFVFCFSINQYMMTTQSNALGEVQGPTGLVNCGTDLSYEFHPQDCAMLDSVFLDGVLANNLIVNETFPTLLIDSVARDHRIKAVFKTIPYQIEVVTDSFSFVDADAMNIVDCDHDFRLTITPDHCHSIAEVLLDGNSVRSDLEEVGTSYRLSLPNVRQNHRIEVVFTKHTHRIVTRQVDAEDHTLSEAESDIVCGRDTTLFAVPYNDCYAIDSVVINGAQVEIQPSYLMQDIAQDVEMSVYMHKKEYTVEIQQLDHAVMTEGALSQTLFCGDTLHLGFAPEEGYYLSGLEVDGEPKPFFDHYVFENIHQNHTVYVFTELYQYEVITTTNEWGTATPDSVVAGYGSDVTVRLVPNDCHVLRAVTVNGTDNFDSLQFHEGYAELTLHSLTSDKAVTAEFGRIEYACSVSDSEGGSVLPSSTLLLCGDTLDVTIAPAACYHIDSVWVNGTFVPGEQLQEVGSEMHYRVENVRRDYHVDVRFERNSYSVTVENHGAGTVVTTASQVLCGDGFSFYIAPAPCTLLQSVRLNGEDITALLTYRENENQWLADTACFTVENVMGDQEIEAFYESDRARHIDVTFQAGTSVLQHEDVTISCGRDTVLSIAHDCYNVDSVLLDGVRVEAESELRLTDVIADHTVQVMLSRTQYRITAQGSPHGTITPTGTTTVACGSNKTYTMVPETGYYIDRLVVDDTLVNLAPTYTFTDIRGDHTIEVTFARYSYLVDVEVDGNGIVVPDDTNVWHGESVHFDLAPADCHTVDSVVVDGVNRGSLTEFDFASVTGSHTLHAYFSQTRYSVTAGVSENGSVTLSGGEVLCGEDVSFTVVPNSCHRLDSVLVNGVNVGAVTSDTVRNVRQDLVVDAYFSRIVYQIAVDGVEHGTVTASATEVSCGESVLLTVQPDACYSLDSVLVNGENVGAVSSYTIADIQGNKSVTAFFSVREYTVEVTAGEHGSVTNEGVNAVRCGEGIAIVITPADCYDIGVVRVDGRWSNPLLHGDTLFLDEIADNHTVSVTFDLHRYYQYTESNIGGNITPAFISAACGGDLTYTIDPIECYRIDTVWINGIVLPQDSLTFSGDVATFTLHDIRQENRLKVRFAGIHYQFEVENNGDGIVRLENLSNTVNCSGSATFYILPAQCDNIHSAFLNDVDITEHLVYHPNVNPLLQDTAFYTISDMNADQLLQINYGRLLDNRVAITYTDGTGDLYAADSVLSCGGTMNLSIGYACHTLDSVLVNGTNVGAQSELVLSSNRTDQTVRAFFSQNRYTVAAEATAGGSIAMDRGPEVACGDTVTCSIIADACHSIDSVVVNGANRGEISSFVFANIVENQNIKAYFSRNEYVIATHSEGSGQVTLDGPSTVLCGDTVTCSIVADGCHSIDSVVVNGANKGAISSFIFENIVGNQEITAYFSQNGYPFVATAEYGGQIEPADTTTVACGEQQTYTIHPDACHSIDSVVVNGMNVGAVTTCTLSCTDEVGAQTIRAFFSQKRYNVRLEAGEGGIITPIGDTLVYCGEPLTVTITPEECYDIETVTVDGSEVEAVGTYQFENVTDTHTVRATFVRRMFNLTPLASTGGSVTPNVTVSVPCDSAYIFTFVPNEGYSIIAVVVDGHDTIATTDLSYVFENVTDHHTVKPLFSRNRYAITATAGEGGSVLPESSMVEYGGRQTITIASDDCYHIDSVFADGIYEGSYPTYTFNNVTRTHELRATFARDAYGITASVEGEGTITPVGTTTVLCGESVTYSFVPAEGWHLTALLVDNAPVDSIGTYTFTNVRDNHTIKAQFAINRYTVTATAGEGGSVTPTTTTADYDESVTVTITAADCHHIDSVFVDNMYVGDTNTYTFSNIDDDHTLRATFAINTYEITAVQGVHGIITPTGDSIVTCGESVTYSIIPEMGWHLTGLSVDDEPVGITETYTFTDVRDNHTITAQFAINEYRVVATAGVGGSVTPTDTTVAYGGSVIVAITAADCHHIDSVFVDNMYVGDTNTYTFSNIDDNHTVRATFAHDAHSITASVEGEGTITSEGMTTVLCGETVTYSFAPATGWHLTALLVDGELVDSIATYTFADVRDNHTITAQFAINRYTVTATAGEGGLVSPTTTTVDYDESVTVTITAADCYHIDSVFVDNIYVGDTNTYTFSNIDDNHTVRATFARDAHSITASVEGEGTITSEGMTTVV